MNQNVSSLDPERRTGLTNTQRCKVLLGDQRLLTYLTAPLPLHSHANLCSVGLKVFQEPLDIKLQVPQVNMEYTLTQYYE